MTRLRFALLTTFYPPHHFGGDAIFVERLATALARSGHAVSVIHDLDAYDVLRGRSGNGERGETTSPSTEGRLEIIGLRSGWGALSPLLTQQLGRPVVQARRLRRMLSERAFDVIHFHNVSLLGGPGLLAYGRGIKLYTAHEHWLVCPTHILWRHARELCDRRECLRCTLAYRRPPQLWRYTKLLERSLSHVDAFIAPSDFSRRKHREFGFPRDFEVIPHFLPEEPLDPSPVSPHPRPYFLFVGRLERIKGLQEVIATMRSRPSADLLVAGDGPYAAELRTLARDDPRITFLGRLGAADLRRHYRHAIALILPSIAYETFGLVALEAFQQGTPVIARRLGPLPELVEPSGGGILFDDAAEMSEAMTLLAGDRALRDRLGEAARAAMATRWSEASHLERYLHLIERIGEAKARPSRGGPLEGG